MIASEIGDAQLRLPLVEETWRGSEDRSPGMTCFREQKETRKGCSRRTLPHLLNRTPTRNLAQCLVHDILRTFELPARFDESQDRLPVVLALVLVSTGLFLKQDAITIFGIYQSPGCMHFFQVL